MRRLSVAPLAFALLLGLGLAPLAEADDKKEPVATPAKQATKLRITEAYVRQPPPGLKNAVAFLKVESADGKAHDIVEVKANVSERAALHTHSHKDGVMRMEAVKKVSIPPKGVIAFAPGGLHVMILGLKAPLKAGAHVVLTFVLADGTSIETTAKVRDTRHKAEQHKGH